MFKWLKRNAIKVKRTVRMTWLKMIVGVEDPKYIAAILDEMRKDAHRNVDIAFYNFANEQTIKELAKSKDVGEVRIILRQMIKNMRTIIILPFKGDLSRFKLPKNWR